MKRTTRILPLAAALLCAVLANAQQTVYTVGGGNHTLSRPTPAQFGDANKYPRWDVAQTWTGAQTFNGATVFGGSINFGSGTLIYTPGSIDWAAVSKSGANLTDIPTRLWANLQSKPTSIAGLGVLNGAALDALAAMSAAGLLVQTTPGTYAARSIIAPTEGIAVSNANGVAGNPTLALANDLAALEGLTTTGLIARTADGQAQTRTIAGTTNQVNVADGGGIGGNPTLSLPQDIHSGASPTFAGLTLSAPLPGGSGGTGVSNTGKSLTLGGNLTTSGAFNTTLTATANTALTLPATGTLATLAGAEMLTNKSISGATNTLTAVPNAALSNSTVTIGTTTIALGGTATTITGLAVPTLDSDAATKGYVDATAQGLDVKQSVRVATTANIILSGTQTIDGVSVVAGNRVLVKNQSDAAQNGIYVVAAGAWSRAADADGSGEVTTGLYAFVSEGSTQGSSGYVLTTADPITLGSTALTFTQFSGAGQIVAGTGLSKSANTLALANTTVTAGTYGSASIVPQVTLDAQGRATAAGNVTIAIAPTQITSTTGTGAAVLASSPILVTPTIGAATGTSLNLTGGGTFGGNLTVSGTGGVRNVVTGTNDAIVGVAGASQEWQFRLIGSTGNLSLYNVTTPGHALSITPTNNATFAGNLTVSGTGSHVFGITDVVTLSAGVVSPTRKYAMVNSATDWLSSDTTPILYGTGASGAGLPFTEAGHLVISPRISGASRDVIFRGGIGTMGRWYGGSGNLDVTGNLTASGTGTHNFAGTLRISGAAVDTTSSGLLSLKMGRINSVPTNATDAFIGINDSAGPGGIAGDIVYIPRSSVGVNSSHRWFGNDGAGTIVERMTLSNSGALILGNYTAGTTMQIRGSNSGNIGGAAFLALAGNNNSIIGIGNKSALIGGGYSATPILWYNGNLEFHSGGVGLVGSLSSTGLLTSGRHNASISAPGDAWVSAFTNTGGSAIMEMAGTIAGPISKATQFHTTGAGVFRIYNNATPGTLGTQALQIDASQNATFSGNVALQPSGIIYTNNLYHYTGGATPLVLGWTGSAPVLSLLASGNATVAGSFSVSGTGEATTGGAGSVVTNGGIFAAKKIIGTGLQSNAGGSLQLNNADSTNGITITNTGATGAGVLTINGPTSTTLAGNLTVSGTGTHTFGGNVIAGANVEVRGAASGTRGLMIRTGTTARWALYGTGEAESTGNAGTNFRISRYDDAGVFLDDALQIARNTGQVSIRGTPTNDTAAAGFVGEYTASTVATNSVALSIGGTSNVTSLSLTPGDWDVSGTVGFTPAATTTVTHVNAGITTTSATFAGTPEAESRLSASLTTGALQYLTTPVRRISVSSTTTVYLVASSIFGVSTMNCGGTIRARRVR